MQRLFLYYSNSLVIVIKRNTRKSDGQSGRKLHTNRTELEFGFAAKMEFKERKKKTIEWYKEQERR